MSDDKDARVNEASALIGIENRVLKIEKSFNTFSHYKVFWIVEFLIFLFLAGYLVESHEQQYSGDVFISFCILIYLFAALPNKLLVLKIHDDVRELAAIYRPILNNIQKHLDKDR